MAANFPCDYCGRPDPTIVIDEHFLCCRPCYEQFYTCRMCEQGKICRFEQDPSPIPKVVMQTIQQGSVVMQRQIKNPERVKAFCFGCPCFDEDDPFCRAEEGWCKNYHEIHPPYREERPEN